MIDPVLLNNERNRFFIQTQGGIYLPLIGIVFWSSIGVGAFILTPRTLCLAVFTIMVISLPLVLIAAKRLLKKPLLQSPLASLIFPSLVPVLMSFGITIPLYFTNIALVPVAFVLGLSFHWPVIAWLHNKRVFLFHNVVRTALTVSLWYFYPEHLFTVLPLSISFLYLVTAAWLFIELRDIRANSVPSAR